MTTPPTASLTDRVADALMRWAESNNNPTHTLIRRPDTVIQNAHGRAAAVLAVVQPELDAARAENERLRQQLAERTQHLVNVDHDRERALADAAQARAQLDALFLAAEDVHTELHTLIVHGTAPGSAARAAWTDLDTALGPLRATTVHLPA